jgi:hypothetical protein
MPGPRAAFDPLGAESIRRCPEDDTAECRTRSEAKGLEIVKGRRKKHKMEFVASGAPVCYLSLRTEAPEGNGTGFSTRSRGAARGAGANQNAPFKKVLLT